MNINLIHKKQTEKEVYENVKQSYNEHPNIFMNPKEWKKLRLVELKNER
jgi:hypothetical protein